MRERSVGREVCVCVCVSVCGVGGGKKGGESLAVLACPS